MPGALHLAFVRSPYAHATIRSVDLTDALAQPGVVAAYAGADLREAWAGGLPCAWPVTADMKAPLHLPLAVEQVAYAGDAVAVVVAQSGYEAVDAAAAVVVDYEPLAAVIDLEAARSDTDLVHPSLGTNVSYVWELIPDPDAVAQAFANAAHVVSERYVQQRLIPSAIEPRGVCVVPEPFGGGLTVYSATQIPHILRTMIAVTTGVPESRLRVVAPSVGGGFGSKLNVYAEELVCVVLAGKLGRPIRWTEERMENALATIQGRGQIQDIELAADADGKLLAVRVELLADMGAYLQLVTPGIPLLGAFLYHGVYDVGSYSFRCTSVFTTKTPTDAYRGAGRPEATYAIERAMDSLARKVGVDAAEIRRRNYIAPDKFPYSSPAGLVFDSGNYEPTLTRALEIAKVSEVRCRAGEQAGSRRHPPPRRRDLDLRGDVRPGTEPSAGIAQLLGRRLGSGDGARHADRQGPGGHRHGAARSGPRDLVVDDRRRPARDPTRGRGGAPFRHGDLAFRHGHLRLAVPGGRRHGDRARH